MMVFICLTGKLRARRRARLRARALTFPVKCTEMARGALHKIGRFRNVPTVGTFINKLKLNLLTNGRYVSETTYFM